jgi:hypothetical protein
MAFFDLTRQTGQTNSLLTLSATIQPSSPYRLEVQIFTGHRPCDVCTVQCSSSPWSWQEEHDLKKVRNVRCNTRGNSYLGQMIPGWATHGRCDFVQWFRDFQDLSRPRNGTKSFSSRFSLRRRELRNEMHEGKRFQTPQNHIDQSAHMHYVINIKAEFFRFTFPQINQDVANQRKTASEPTI